MIRWWSVVLFCCLVLLNGCSTEPQFKLNQVALLTTEKIEFQQGKTFSPQQLETLESTLTEIFGTPSEPIFPEFGGRFAGLVSLDHLAAAAGAVKSDREGTASGLYREHCAACHGITGDGGGPMAGFSNPYPRDFRLGKFKFRSSELNLPASDSDLDWIIERGIPGTAMPSFRLLPEAERKAIVDYVKYLSIRGMVERKLIEKMARTPGDLDWLSNWNPQNADAALTQVVAEVLEFWRKAQYSVASIGTSPAAVSVDHPDHVEFVETGRALFVGKANCQECHGVQADGLGESVNYDAWTESWSADTGVNVDLPGSYREFLDAGALPPRPADPRNLRRGVFRGGSAPQAIYHRIDQGIQGTPMPAAVTLTDEEKWALVAYVISL